MKTSMLRYALLTTLTGLVALLPPFARAQDQVVITEFMAINDRTLADEYGQFPDWIEIYNVGVTTVNLAGWHLTDSINNPIKWTFPATNLPPKAFLIVFASGDNRAIPGLPLHTSFALRGGGEYLALVRPDGTNIASQFFPQYPQQYPDVSYGSGETRTLLGAEAPVKVFIPTNSALGLDWTSNSFAEAGWIAGTNGVGYETLVPGFAVSNYKAVGQIGSLAGAEGLLADPLLRSSTNSENAPFINYFNTGSDGHAGANRTFPGMTIGADVEDFVVEARGTVTLPTAGNWTFVVSSDDGFKLEVGNFSMEFAGTRGAGDSVDTFNFPAAGTYPIRLVFFERGGGSEVELWAAPGQVAQWNATNFRLVGDVLQGGLEVTSVPVIGGTQGGGYRTQIRTDIESQMLNQSVSAYVRIPFTLTNTAAFESLSLRMQYDDAFVAYLNGVEVARRNAPAVPAWDSPAVATHNGSVVETINLTDQLGLVQDGINILALHGMNDAADGTDFFLRAELIEFRVGGTVPGYFDTATPGLPNGRPFPLAAEPVVFSQPGGVLTNSMVLELSSPTPGALIRYTLNGDRPTEDSLEYTGPITISNSVMVTAVAFGLNAFATEPVSHSYTVLDADAAAFSSNLPLMIIDTYGQVIRQDMEPRVTAALTVIDRPTELDRVTLRDRPDYHGRAGVEGRGQTSWGFPKKPMNIELRDAFDRDRNASLLGMPAESDWILLNPYSDKTFMNNYLAYELHEKMGHYAVRRRYVEVFVNGQWEGGAVDPSGQVGTNDYVGLYVLLERIKIDKNRVNIARLQPEDSTEPNITGGYIWKKDKNSPGDINFSTAGGGGFPGQGLKYHDPDTALTTAQRGWLVNHLNAFESALYGPNWRDPVNGYAQYIDVDSFVDFHWIVEFSKQIDGYRLSNFMHKDRGGKIKMEPIWDWNLSFGNANYLRGGMTNGWYWNLGPNNPQSEGIGPSEHIWLRRLIYGEPNINAASVNDGPGDPDFKQKIVDRWGELRATLFHPSNVLARVDEITNQIYEAQARDFARWPRLGQYIWPNPNGGTWSVDYEHPTSYDGIIAQMKQWITGRYAWIDSQFVPAPNLSRPGGLAHAPFGMWAPVGTIYYTTNGSDPRLPGGAISPHALAYTNFIVPAADARIFARTWQTNHWSAPARATFGYPTPQLALTELMYHPLGSTDTNFNDEDFEFLEFMNPGSNAIDLAGLRLADGVSFAFPAGPPSPLGEVTTNDFDGHGTAFTLATLGEGPGPVVTNGGPAGSYLRLIQQDTGTNRNRLAFDQTAAGPYDRVVAEFDFRARDASPPPPAGTPLHQDFDQPGTPYTLTNYTGAMPQVLPGDTHSAGRFLRLTARTNDQQAAIAFDRTMTGAYSHMRITFDFRITGAADGLGLALLSTSTYGVTGVPATGIDEEVRLFSTLGIGFDVWNNGLPADPNANHVSLHRNAAKLADATPGFPLAAGRFHRAQIDFRFAGGDLFVTLRITPDVLSGTTTAETLFDDFRIASIGPFEHRLAFGARTGGGIAEHDLDNIAVEYFSDVAPAGGLSLALLPVAAFGTNGPGTTLSHYVDEPRLTNGFALNLDVHRFDLVNNVNLFWDGDRRFNGYVPPDVLDLDNGVFHHVKLELTRASEGTLASVTLTPDIYGAPGAPVNVVSNLLISQFTPGDARVELAGRSGGLNLDVDVENVLVRFEQFGPNWLNPGERIVVVNNRAAFEARYGAGIRVVGEYSGALANGGENLRLTDAWGAPLLDFAFKDGWYPLTDGQGFSLVFEHPEATVEAYANRLNWRASSAVGGSPGQVDAAAAAFVPVVINEALTATPPPGLDVIELHNPSTNQADVSYWYLTDDFDAPKKFQIPAPAQIPPGGFLTFTENEFNPVPGSSNSFALRAEGEAVYLFSANAAGELTGYYHGFAFGPAESDVTFGRHVTSTGAEHFVAQRANTLGQTNAGPRVGPVVISEIMYHPPEHPDGRDNQADEFIELRNITEQPVALYDALFPANSWRLRSAVDFEFPPLTVIPGLGTLVVVSFDPSVNTDRASAFRARYNVDPSVPLVGPYRGKLSNDHDSVELKKPGSPDPDTGQPDYVLVDEVEYADAAPWALAADGIGPSLQRVDITQYGNDPANWFAGQPNPGGAGAPGTPPTITAQPADQSAVSGNPVTFRVTATDSEPLRYQWRFNGRNLAGATNAALLLPAVQLAQAGDYQVVVLNANASVVSDPARLTVQQGATILVSPQSQMIAMTITPSSISPNVDVTFNVTALGNGPISYQWRRDGVNLAGATEPSLTINTVRPEDAGFYTVAVTDGIGTSISDPGHLDVQVRPYIIRRPVSKTVVAGESVSFTVEVTNVTTFPISYAWRRYGREYTNMVIDSHVSVLEIPVVVSNLHAGLWDVAIANAAGRVPGFPPRANLTVRQPPYFLQHPSNLVVNPGEDAVFTAAATGNAPLSYQWYFNETNLLAGATVPSLSVTNAQTNNEGAYTVVAENAYGTATSGVATLTLRRPPTIVTQPSNLAIAICATNVGFLVEAAGGEPYEYQWYFNETNVMAGATNATLAFAPPTADAAGAYRVVVANALGTATSQVATLSFLWGDCDGDGLPDQWELTYGLDPTDPADGELDSDGDGLTNREEYTGNTNPRDSASVLKVRLADGGNGGAIIEFVAMPDVGYTIQYRNDLATAPWINWTNLPPQAGTNTLHITDPDAGLNGNRFYRIVTPMQTAP